MNADELMLGLQMMKGIGNVSILRLTQNVAMQMGIEDWLTHPFEVLREIWRLPIQKVEEILPKRESKAFEEGRKNNSFNQMLYEKKKMQESGVCYLPIFHSQYPKKLLDIADPPVAVFVKGKIDCLKKPCVAVIGARICSEYGSYVARCYGKKLGEAGVTVVSGMAAGIDGIAQRAALQAGGASLGVLGCGVDVCYPPENRELYHLLQESGCLISEYFPKTKASAGHFPMRNRIISALSDAVIVIEARQKSGTQITADLALEQGKEVYAVPGRVTDSLSAGCNILLSQGAGVALSPDRVLEELWGNPVWKEKETVDTKAKEQGLRKLILDALDITPKSLEKIYDEVSTKAEAKKELKEVAAVIMELCMEGVVKQNYVNCFSIKN